MSKRLETDGGGALDNNPFGNLSSDGLPDRPAVTPQSKRKEKKAPKKGRVELRREKAGRGGKTVTTLSAFATHLPLGELEKLAFDLKKTCACGGTLKGRTIELQGDVREKAFAQLEARGFTPVRAGG
jgi:translation initiation factor 1